MLKKVVRLIRSIPTLLMVMLIGINPQEIWADTDDTLKPKASNAEGGDTSPEVLKDIESGSESCMQHDGSKLSWPTDGQVMLGETRDG